MPEDFRYLLFDHCVRAFYDNNNVDGHRARCQRVFQFVFKHIAVINEKPPKRHDKRRMPLYTFFAFIPLHAFQYFRASCKNNRSITQRAKRFYREIIRK